MYRSIFYSIDYKIIKLTMISIIIPIFNSGKYIYNCLNSIAKQTYSDYELILVNDCSTDNSLQILEAFQRQHPQLNVSIISLDKNQGQSFARNIGIQNSIGEYILFIDSDDSVSADCLELMINKMEVGHFDMVIGENIIRKDSQDKYISVGFLNDEVYGNKEILNLFLNGQWYNPVWNKLIKKDIITHNNLYFKEGYIFEDELWSFMLATKIESLCVIRKPLYTYFIHQNSTMTSNRSSKRWNGLLKIIPFMKEYIMEHDLKNNLEISRFYLFKLINVLNGLEKEKQVNSKKYKQIHFLWYSSLTSLFKNKMISTQLFFAYFHLSLPYPLSFVYYRIINLYFGIRHS